MCTCNAPYTDSYSLNDKECSRKLTWTKFNHMIEIVADTNLAKWIIC